MSAQLASMHVYCEKAVFTVAVEDVKAGMRIGCDFASESSKLLNLPSSTSAQLDVTDIPIIVSVAVPDSFQELPSEIEARFSVDMAESPNHKSMLSKSDLNISFDKDCQNELVILKQSDQDETAVVGAQDVDDCKSSIGATLDRISGLQPANNSQYLKLIGAFKKDDMPKQSPAVIATERSSSESEANIFEFESENFNDMLNKQTPELGSKSDHPEYLKDYFQALTNSVSNTGIRMNIDKNLMGQAQTRDYFKSQKILFQL